MSGSVLYERCGYSQLPVGIASTYIVIPEIYVGCGGGGLCIYKARTYLPDNWIGIFSVSLHTGLLFFDDVCWMNW